MIMYSGYAIKKKEKNAEISEMYKLHMCGI
jgi:hypothetical protein